MATSLVIPGHRISQADGSDHAFLGHLKKHLQILEGPIHGTVTVSSLKKFCKKILNFYRNQLAVQKSRFWEIYKENLMLYKINPPSWSSLRIFLEIPSNFNQIKSQSVPSVISTWSTLYLQFEHQNVLILSTYNLMKNSKTITLV